MAEGAAAQATPGHASVFILRRVAGATDPDG